MRADCKPNSVPCLDRSSKRERDSGARQRVAEGKSGDPGGRRNSEKDNEFSVGTAPTAARGARSGAAGPERQRDSSANLWSPEVNCRPPWGSQKCVTVVEFSVCVMIAMQIHHRLWTDSSERERDSGANLCSPEVNCRPPWGEPEV